MLHRSVWSWWRKAGVIGSVLVRGILLAMVSALCASRLTADPPKRPNVLLIHCHDLGQFLQARSMRSIDGNNRRFRVACARITMVTDDRYIHLEGIVVRESRPGWVSLDLPPWKT